MKEFVIKLKDNSKYAFLLELLKQLDFIEIQSEQSANHQKSDGYDFFKSAGLFSGRNIDANQVRKQAWRIKK